MISWKAAKKLWRPANCTLFNTSQVAAANSPHYMFAEAASAASLRFRGSAISSDSEFTFSSTGGCTSTHQPQCPPSLSQFPTWIHLELQVHTWGPNVIRVRCFDGASALCLHGLHSPPRRADFFQWLPIRVGCDSLLAQHPLQPWQVHARNQGSHRTAEHPPPARWRWRGRSRWSAWRLAPPTRPIPPRRRCYDIIV